MVFVHVFVCTLVYQVLFVGYWMLYRMNLVLWNMLLILKLFEDIQSYLITGLAAFNTINMNLVWYSLKLIRCVTILLSTRNDQIILSDIAGIILRYVDKIISNILSAIEGIITSNIDKIILSAIDKIISNILSHIQAIILSNIGGIIWSAIDVIILSVVDIIISCIFRYLWNCLVCY
eukprot:104877_1